MFSVILPLDHSVINESLCKQNNHSSLFNNPTYNLTQHVYNKTVGGVNSSIAG